MSTNQLSQANPLFGNQMQHQTEPVEYGQIIRWRQGEIIGLGSSSIVYSAIRVDNNTLLAVKKFKVVSDVSGIDQPKLKIIKVSKTRWPISDFFYCIERNPKVQAVRGC
jgi:hypothetical protein